MRPQRLQIVPTRSIFWEMARRQTTRGRRANADRSHVAHRRVTRSTGYCATRARKASNPTLSEPRKIRPAAFEEGLHRLARFVAIELRGEQSQLFVRSFPDRRC